MKTLTALLMIALIAQVASAQPARDRRRPVEIPPNIEITRDVEYGKGGSRPLTMHILRPKTLPAGPMPGIVWIHGGAWLGGNKEGAIPQLIPYAQRGCFCATIEYRLSQEAKFPAQIEDCKCAIRFLRAKAKEYRLDPDRVGVWGSSAGGHLVAMLGVTGGVKELEGQGGWADFSSRVNAVCDWFGPSDLLTMKDFPSRIDRRSATCPEALLIGGALDANTEKAAKASPITYVTKDAPPFLIMHGDKDDVVPYNQSEILYEALKKAGGDVAFHPVKGAGHGFGGPENLRIVSEFFDKHLRISEGGK